MASFFHPADYGQASNYLGFFGDLVNSGYNIDRDNNMHTIDSEYDVNATKWNISVAVNMIPIIGNIICRSQDLI